MLDQKTDPKGKLMNTKLRYAWLIFFISLACLLAIEYTLRFNLLGVSYTQFSEILFWGSYIPFAGISAYFVVQAFKETTPVIKRLSLISLNIGLGFVLLAAITLFYGIETGMDSL